MTLADFMYLYYSLLEILLLSPNAFKCFINSAVSHLNLLVLPKSSSIFLSLTKPYKETELYKKIQTSAALMYKLHFSVPEINSKVGVATYTEGYVKLKKLSQTNL